MDTPFACGVSSRARRRDRTRNRGGTDESGAAKQLLDLRGPPDGEVAAGADADFFLAISVCCGDRAGWGDGAGAARATGSDWRRPDRDSTAVGLFGVLSLRHFGWSFYPFARGYRRIRRGEAFARPARAA